MFVFRLVVRSLAYGVWCLVFVDCRDLRVVRQVLSAIVYSVFVICCLLCGACCVLVVGCWLMDCWLLVDGC